MQERGSSISIAGGRIDTIAPALASPESLTKEEQCQAADEFAVAVRHLFDRRDNNEKKAQRWPAGVSGDSSETSLFRKQSDSLYLDSGPLGDGSEISVMAGYLKNDNSSSLVVLTVEMINAQGRRQEGVRYELKDSNDPDRVVQRYDLSGSAYPLRRSSSEVPVTTFNFDRSDHQPTPVGQEEVTKLSSLLEGLQLSLEQPV